MAITYGMSVKEFWEDNPDLFWAYRFSYYSNKEQEKEEINYKAWLNGLYTYNAIMVGIHNSFEKEKIDYPGKPLEFDAERAKLEQEEKMKEEQAKLIAQLQERVKKVREIKNK